MTTVDEWPVSPEHFWLRGQRPEHPVRYDPETGMCDVYGYAEAQVVLADQRLFSSDTARVAGAESDAVLAEANLVQMDPPAHRKMRGVLSAAFTPEAVSRLAPRIDEIARALLDEVAGRERIELVEDFAGALPILVITELLGVPVSERHLFRKWADGILDGGSEFDRGWGVHDRLESMRQVRDYLRDHAAERRVRPREDLLSRIARAEIDGARLTEDQVLNLATFVLLAGHATTAVLIGNAVLCLLAHPEQAARVVADRSLVPGAIEESLRFLGPVATTFRATTADAVLGGRRVPLYRSVAVWLGAANRDPRRFTDPDRFQVTRRPNPHLGLGRGGHFCLGAPLVGLEVRIALNALLDRLPGMRTDPAEPPRFRSGHDVTGVLDLPLRTG